MDKSVKSQSDLITVIAGVLASSDCREREVQVRDHLAAAEILEALDGLGYLVIKGEVVNLVINQASK